ncbi:MAG: sugar phosphate nucleotidyltransferase [Oscillospiraceae bacterium]|nr:sugar phosphate nucleotidyltransferase [Oscillospiraceae bacterium]
MKALILNSGIGKRMGGLTSDRCKCMVEIANGASIIDEQLKRLHQCGIDEICVTTGPFAGELESYLRSGYPNTHFEFINNPLYAKTNYIYSIYLARESLDSDILMLHGDLVFETSVLQDIMSSKQSVMAVDSTKPLPVKDFKAVVKNGRVISVGVEFFDDAIYAQPLYKLLRADWEIWLGEICRFCSDGTTDVYAENALNGISDKLNLFPLDALGRACFEIDDLDDLAYAKKAYAKLS